MKKHSQIQTFFWKIANYNTFFMKFCDTSFNNVAGIGLIFFMQSSIVFFSGFSSAILFNLNWIFSIMIGLLFSSISFFYIKFSTLFLKEDFNKNRLLILFLCSAIISFLICLPFLITIFQTQIEYVFYLNESKLNLTYSNKIWKLPYGLYKVWLNPDNGIVVFIMSSCLYLLLLFTFYYPYLLIFQNKNTVYHKIQKLYEGSFIQEEK